MLLLFPFFFYNVDAIPSSTPSNSSLFSFRSFSSILHKYAIMLSGRSEVIAIVTAVFLGISLVTVILRCFVRLRVVRAFGWDDGLMLLAMVCVGLCYLVG